MAREECVESLEKFGYRLSRQVFRELSSEQKENPSIKRVFGKTQELCNLFDIDHHDVFINLSRNKAIKSTKSPIMIHKDGEIYVPKVNQITNELELCPVPELSRKKTVSNLLPYEIPAEPKKKFVVTPYCTINVEEGSNEHSLYTF